MRVKRVFINIKCLGLILIVMVTIAIMGCQSETALDELVSESRVINFGAAIRDNVGLVTRSGADHEQDVGEIESMNSNPYGMDFFIEVCCDVDADDSAPTLGTYRIPSGFSGWLQSKDTKERLTWRDLKAVHTFYGWNLPWTTKSYLELVKEQEDTAIPDAEKQPLAPLKIHFHDSREGEEYDKNQNDSIYKYFVGVKREDVSYPNNGQYVELVFRHLVSRIFIDKLSMIEGPHTIQNDLKADMTIYGMPKSATFYPHPGDEVYPKGDGYPVVIADEVDVANDNAGVTYFIPNDPKGEIESVFYVCPDIDFSDLVFEIKINDENYSQYGSYWGNFNNVEFKRAGNNYDWTEGDDTKILHAGEEMHLVIELYQGMGPGLSVVIEPWSTESADGRNAVHHSHAGIYTDSEAQDLIDAFTANDQERISNLHDLYGEDGENGEKVFKLYENVKVNGSNFPVGEGYVVDGMGHTLTMSSASNTVTVGNVRDVYITDGKNTIWIDPEGNIWKLDTTTNEFEQTDYKLKNGGSTKINLTTGAVS